MTVKFETGAVYRRSNWVELVEMLNVPPVNELAKPLVPFADAVLIVKALAAKPLMLENVPRTHEPSFALSKLIAAPFVSGPTPDSDHRLTLNLLPEFAVMEKEPVEKVS